MSVNPADISSALKEQTTFVDTFILHGLPDAFNGERLTAASGNLWQSKAINSFSAAQALENKGMLPSIKVAPGDKKHAEEKVELNDMASDAHRLKANLSQLHGWAGGSNQDIEKDIRDTISTMNAAEIGALKQEYKKLYNVELESTLKDDKKLSSESKAALGIYLKGSDQLRPTDTIALADIATKAGNLDMFEEAFRNAAPEARTKYLASGGEAKVQKAFSGFFSHSDVRQALDYVNYGRLSVATQIKDNTGIFSSNHDAIKHAQAQWEQEMQAMTASAAPPDILTNATAGSATFDRVSRDEFNRARDKEEKGNSGIGRSIVHSLWDGTSAMTTNALNQYAADLSQASAAGQTLSSDRVRAHKQDLYQSMALLKQSKSAAADSLIDAAIMTAGLGRAAFGGETSLSALGLIGLVGAATKIGAKSAIVGNDYAFNSKQLFSDGATGAVNAASMFITPAQLGRALGFGGKVTLAVGERAATSLGADVALNSALGGLTGTASGTVEGVTKWDNNRSLRDNLSRVGNDAIMRGATGALLAGVLSGTIGGAMRMVGASERAPLAISEHLQTAEKEGSIESKFAPINAADRPSLRVRVQSELQDVKAIGADGNATSAYDSLMQDKTLSAAQKLNVIDNLGMVREHLASYRLGDRMHPDPEVNWIHTQGEIAKVLEAGRAKNLNANDLEDSLLASMYSDSVKFSAPSPEGTTPNFHTHHLDGARAAAHSLRQQNFPQDRSDRIVEAILAHQIAPPKFMGQLYYMKINGTLEAMIKDGKIGAEEGQKMRAVLATMTETGPDNVKRISQLAHVNEAPRVTDASGLQQVAFTPEQQKVFALSGTDRWVLPYDPRFDAKFAGLSRAAKERQLSRQKIVLNLIDGDAIDNYATSGGASKIVAIRGPQTYFADPTVWDSIASIDASFKDAYSVLTPEGKHLADQSLASRNQIIDRNNGSLKSFMDNWLKSSQGLDPARENIAFYNAPLTYAKPGETLTPEQVKQTELAKEIRSQVVDFLRRDHRTDNSLPGNFTPVRSQVLR